MPNATLLAAQSPPPDEAWRNIETPHFRITFPASLEPLGRRAALIAEDARARLVEAFMEAADGRIDLVLTDHVDVSNGFASVAPRRRVVIYARPPIDGQALAYYDDWLDLVIVHELAHILHLDRAGGPGRLLRGLFGRVPAAWPFFPGLATPRWVVEGLATFYESALTESGRVHGSVFPMYLRSAALAGRLEGIDQASGQSAVWPDGQRPYLYGSLFFEWLLERHGEEHMREFVEAVAGQWIPYRLNSAARTAFGESFTEAWAVWAGEVQREARRLADVIETRSPSLPRPEPLTSGLRQATFPRVSPDGSTWAYAHYDGRSDTQLRVVRPDGSHRSIRTNGSAAFDWLPDGGLVHGEFELEGPWRVRTDLVIHSADGARRRLTRGARLDHPSAAPSGDWVAAVRTREGFTDLVRVDLADGAVRPIASGSDSVHWAFPAVSPDGRWIAASRWSPGGLFDVVVVDATDGRVVVRLDPVRAVDLSPTWSPDGSWLVWVSDRSGIPNLLAARVDPAAGSVGEVRQVSDVVTGVAHPSVSPDGRWIHLSLYGAEGWDVARVPFRPDDWRDPVARAVVGAGVVAEAGRVSGVSGPAGAQGGGSDGVRPRFAAEELDALEVGPYRSVRSLRPRYWEPLLLPDVSSRGTRVMGPFVGAGTRIFDVVERHTLAASAAVAVDRGKVAAAAGYTWAGWGNPLFSLTASQNWDAGGPFTAGEGRSVFIEERERRASAALTLLRSRWRSNVALTGSAGVVWEDRTLLDADDLRPSDDFRLTRPASRLGDLRLSASVSTARGHALSLSAERGVSLFVQARTRPQLELADSLSGVAGFDRSVDEVIGQARAFASFRAWGWTDHVLALRLAAARAGGPGADAFWYDAGGAAGQGEPITGLGLFGGQGLFFPIRGYDDGDRSGSRAWVASGEWRFPIWWVNRGWGVVPVHLDRFHGALFADVGNAWGPELPLPGYMNPRRDALASVGAELRLDALVFFTIPLHVRVGLASPLIGDAAARFYLRLGPSF
ncbi:MAG: hypothetical protein HKN71_13310 [Gemmatimonadetes bacterium]|nr:hypothetical protein [Gemmatimonadota bacterium]